MTTIPTHTGLPRTSTTVMARWRYWLFNLMARWEEATIAQALGLPREHVFLVDLSADEGSREL